MSGTAYDGGKHPRDGHGRFAAGSHFGAAAGAAGGAAGVILGATLLGRRFAGFGLARRGAGIVQHAASQAAPEAVHAAEVAPQIVHRVHQAKPFVMRSMRHGVHTPIGRAARVSVPGISGRDQHLSRAFRGLAHQVDGKVHIDGKRMTGRDWNDAAHAYETRRALAAQIRAHRRQSMGKLAKFAEAEHPRGGHGQFVAGASAPVGVQRRTLHRLPSHYRMAGRVAHGKPAPADTEPPAGSFLRATLPFHQPKAVSPDDRKALEHGIIGIVNRLREPTIARGIEPKGRGVAALIPDGTPKRSVVRAYHHAALIAVHKYGLGHYDFAMDEHTKAELTPLEPFMRYAERRVRNTMLEEHKGGWKPYRAEFGQAFADKRKDADGNVRLRVKPLQQMIKGVVFGTLCKAVFEEDKHKRDGGGRFASAGRVAGNVAYYGLGGVGMALAHAGIRAALTRRRNLREAVKAFHSVAPNAMQTLARAKPISYRGALRHWRSFPDHIRDIVTEATRPGKRATVKQLRRQFARDSFMGRERLIATTRDGIIRRNVTGGPNHVELSDADVAALGLQTQKGQLGRLIHNHPFDTVPSAVDSEAARIIDGLGPRKIHHRVYGFGETANGKLRTRVTRFDGKGDTALIDKHVRDHEAGVRPISDWRSRPAAENELTEELWDDAKRRLGSNYRTKAVEKAVPIGMLSKAILPAALDE